MPLITAKELALYLKEDPENILLGISGFAGSGKTTFALQVKKYYSNLNIIHADAFFKKNQLKNILLWESIDTKRLNKEIITPFLNGSKTLKYGVFCWETNSISHYETIHLKEKKLIIEGVGIFTERLWDLFTKHLWINCNIEVANKKGRERDEESYHIPQKKEWSIYKKNDLNFYNTYLTSKAFDFTVKCPII